jgi:hypothetical protein
VGAKRRKTEGRTKRKKRRRKEERKEEGAENREWGKTCTEFENGMIE